MSGQKTPEDVVGLNNGSQIPEAELDQNGRPIGSGASLKKMRKAWKAWTLGTTAAVLLGGGAWWGLSNTDKETTKEKTTLVQKNVSSSSQELEGELAKLIENAQVSDQMDATAKKADKGVKKTIKTTQGALDNAAQETLQLADDALAKLSNNAGTAVQNLQGNFEAVKQTVNADGLDLDSSLNPVKLNTPVGNVSSETQVPVISIASGDKAAQRFAKDVTGETIKAGNVPVDQTVLVEPWRIEMDKQIIDYSPRTQLALRMGMKYLQEYVRYEKASPNDRLVIASSMRDLRDRIYLLEGSNKGNVWMSVNNDVGTNMCAAFEKDPNASFDDVTIARAIVQNYQRRLMVEKERIKEEKARIKEEKARRSIQVLLPEQPVVPVETVEGVPMGVKLESPVTEAAAGKSDVEVRRRVIEAPGVRGVREDVEASDVRIDENEYERRLRIRKNHQTNIDITLAKDSEQKSDVSTLNVEIPQTSKLELKNLPQLYQGAVKESVEIFTLQNRWFEAASGSEERKEIGEQISEHLVVLKEINPAMNYQVVNMIKAARTKQIYQSDFRFNVPVAMERLVQMKETFDAVNLKEYKPKKIYIRMDNTRE